MEYIGPEHMMSIAHYSGVTRQCCHLLLWH